MASQKRFIAGAVCPRCGAMDRVMMFRDGEKQFRECVACGFSDEMRLSYPGREPATRVNRREEERPVRLMDPGRDPGDE